MENQPPQNPEQLPVATGHLHLSPERQGWWNSFKDFFSFKTREELDADVEDFFYVTEGANGKKLHLVHHATVLLPGQGDKVGSQSRWIPRLPQWFRGFGKSATSASSFVSSLGTEATKTLAQATPTLENIQNRVEDTYESLTDKIKDQTPYLTEATLSAEGFAERVYHSASDAANDAYESAQRVLHSAENSAQRLFQSGEPRRVSMGSPNLTSAPLSLLLTSLFGLYLILLHRRVLNLRRRTEIWWGDGVLETVKETMEPLEGEYVSPPVTPRKSETTRSIIKFKRYNDLTRALEGCQQVSSQLPFPLIALLVSEMTGAPRVLIGLIGLGLFLAHWMNVEVGIMDKEARPRIREFGSNLVNFFTGLSLLLGAVQGARSWI